MEFNGTFLATIITFIIFVFVMNKILYKPILSIMEERRNLIATNYKDADDNTNKAAKINEQIGRELENAKDGARSKYLESVNEFKNERDERINSVKLQTNEELKVADEALKRLSDEVKDGLKGAMSNLADDITEKIIGYRTNINEINEDRVNSVLWGEGK